MDINKYIFEKDGLWYFWDETGDEMGPYETRKECIEKLDEYIYWLNS